jgi:hypothetical protein
MKSNYDPVFQEAFFFDTSHGVPQASPPPPLLY